MGQAIELQVADLVGGFFAAPAAAARQNLSDRRVPMRWRTLNLENEYLKVVVLPDLGGHLYTKACCLISEPKSARLVAGCRGAVSALRIPRSQPRNRTRFARWIGDRSVHSDLAERLTASTLVTVTAR